MESAFQFLGFLILLIIVLVINELYKTSNKKFIQVGKKEYKINFANMNWSDNNLTLNEGDQITWKNLSDIRIQLVTDDPITPNSEILSNYDEYTYVFMNSGKYRYKVPLYSEVPIFTVTVVK